MKPVRTGVIALAAVAAGLSVASCYSTPDYAPAGTGGNPYGYTDAPVQGGARSIRVTLPSSTQDPQLAYVYWNRRAEELCGGAVLRKQIHTAQRQLWDYNALSGVSGDYVLEGYVWCASSTDTAPPAPAPTPTPGS